jgi:hypothetical protein
VALNNGTGTATGYAVQNLSGAAGAYSGMLFFDQNGALGQFQGFNNSTHEYRINNVASSGKINFMIGSSSKFLVANDGNIGLGVPAPASRLDVAGDVNTSTQYNIQGQRVLFATGGFLTQPPTMNLFVGVGAGTSNGGTDNSFVGFRAGERNSGSRNSFLGREAGYQLSFGDDNTFIGAATGSGSQSDRNTIIGSGATGHSNTTNATAIGFAAFVGQSNSLVLGSGVNVGIGTSRPQYILHVVGEDVRVEGDNTGTFPRFSLNFTGADPDQGRWQNYAAANGLNFTALNDAENGETFWLQVNRGPGTAISSIVFPNGVRGVTTGSGDAVNVVIDSNGQLGTISSSRRFKEDIHDMGDASRGLMRLRPVTFRYKKPFDDGSKPIQYGLIAEEVAEVYPDLVAHSADGQIETVKYQVVEAMLLNEVQQQQADIRALQLQNNDLQRRLASLEAALARRRR